MEYMAKLIFVILFTFIFFKLLYYFIINIMSLNKTTNIKFSDLRKEFTTNTNNLIKYSSLYTCNNINTFDINNIPNLLVANSSMKLSNFKSVGKILFNITVSWTESTTIPQPVLITNSSSNYYLRLLHQGNNNTSTTSNYTEYNIRFPFTVNAEVLLVGGGGGKKNSIGLSAGGNAGNLLYILSYTFTENITYKIRK